MFLRKDVLEKVLVLLVILDVADWNCASTLLSTLQATPHTAHPQLTQKNRLKDGHTVDFEGCLLWG